MYSKKHNYGTSSDTSNPVNIFFKSYTKDIKRKTQEYSCVVKEKQFPNRGENENESKHEWMYIGERRA